MRSGAVGVAGPGRSQALPAGGVLASTGPAGHACPDVSERVRTLRAASRYRMAHPMTAPERPASGLDANARGIIVLVVAVLVGVALLLNVGNDSGQSSASPTTTTAGTTLDIGGTTTTVAGDTTGTTGAEGETTTTVAGDNGGEARDAADVSVVVLNGSSKTGAAQANSDTIAAQGYQMGSPGNPVTNIEGNTVVYYAEGYQADAVAVAAVLGRPADAVQAKPAEDLGPGSADANVVVVLGAADTSPVN